MPDLAIFIAGALLTLPALLLIISGQLYLLHGKVKPMSLLQDFEAFVARIEALVEKLPLFHDRLLQANALVGELQADKDAVVAEKDGLLARFAAVEQKLAAVLDVPGETADQPAP
jgi:hypothetical protein